METANKRNVSVQKYILLSQVLFFLLLGVLVLRVAGFTYEGLFIKMSTLLIFIVLLSMVPLLLQFNLKQNNNLIIMVDFMIILIYLVTATILLVNEVESLFKVILLMPVVITAVKYGMKLSLAAAVLSLISLMAISFLKNFVLIDAVVVFGGVILLLAWLLGNMTETEKAIRTELSQDIAERKKTEEALRESEERYRKLVELSPDGIVIYSEETIIFANKAGAVLFGFNHQEELLGKKICELAHQDYRDMIKMWMKQVISDESTKPYLEVKCIKSSGEVIDVEMEAAQFSYQGKRAGQVIIRDTTERKRMEEELIKASKLESVGVLAGGIAHDFNNLLTIIYGNISLAKMTGPNNEKYMKFLTEVEKAADQAKDLTQQLLIFSKGGKPVKKIACIGELLNETVKLILSGSNVKSNFAIDGDLFLVEIDEGQVKQVINNLVINATQAMPEGGTIWVTAENRVIDAGMGERCNTLSPGKYVMVNIKDEGTGIPPENLLKIFDPYFTTKEKGNGLGLATSYSIIKNHDGYIDVASEMGTGTIFSIYLPAALNQQLAPNEQQQKVHLSTGKILVMDDEEAVRDVAIKILEQLGYEAYPARDGNEVIEMYQQAQNSGQGFDIVIMDLTVPGGMGGKQTIQKLLEFDPQVKGIVSSGYFNDHVMANYQEYGFAGYITKPYTAHELTLVLTEIMNNLAS